MIKNTNEAIKPSIAIPAISISKTLLPLELTANFISAANIHKMLLISTKVPRLSQKSYFSNFKNFLKLYP